MSNAFVRKLKGIAPLNDEEVRLLTEVCDTSRSVAAHRDLIREGDKPGPGFIVLDGWACRYKVLPDGSRQIVAFMMPGDFCDVHASTLDRIDHSIGTVTPCQIATVARETMEALIVATPMLTRSFWRAQLIDEGVLRAWIVSIGRRNASKRVAHLMLELFVRMRAIGLTHDGTCQLPLTQTLIADALGLTPVHTNRVLRGLREQGVMALNSGMLAIMDIGALVKIAGFDDSYLRAQAMNAA